MEDAPYTQYKVEKPLAVDAGVVAPWFGETGMGTQYVTDMTIQELYEAGIISIIE